MFDPSTDEKIFFDGGNPTPKQIRYVFFCFVFFEIRKTTPKNEKKAKNKQQGDTGLQSYFFFSFKKVG